MGIFPNNLLSKWRLSIWSTDDETMKSFAFLNNEHLPELESLKLAIAGYQSDWNYVPNLIFSAKITDQGLKSFLAAFEGKSDNIKELSLDLSG